MRCIEHGNLVDDVTARRMAELDVTMVPTLVTYKAMAEMGAKVGLPARNVSKNEGVFDQGRRSIEVAKRAGVALGLGTDLLGEAQPWQKSVQYDLFQRFSGATQELQKFVKGLTGGN